MVDEETRKILDRRNADLNDYYVVGHTVRECAAKFNLSRQRITQLLIAAGLWKTHVKTNRTEFLGVNLSERTKTSLRRLAKDKQTSSSQLASDILDKAVERDDTSAR